MHDSLKSLRGNLVEGEAPAEPRQVLEITEAQTVKKWRFRLFANPLDDARLFVYVE